MSITHTKIINLVLNLLINCICARSAPQILSIIDDCTFLLLHFLIIGLCNSSANSYVWSENLAMRAKSKGRLFEIFSFLIALPEVFLSKNL